jgi:hypothetical protein
MVHPVRSGGPTGPVQTCHPMSCATGTRVGPACMRVDHEAGRNSEFWSTGCVCRPGRVSRRMVHPRRCGVHAGRVPCAQLVHTPTSDRAARGPLCRLSGRRPRSRGTAERQQSEHVARGGCRCVRKAEPWRRCVRRFRNYDYIANRTEPTFSSTPLRLAKGLPKKACAQGTAALRLVHPHSIPDSVLQL